jgi:hypothetical protein
MRVMTAVGARPQFIKAAPVSLALQEAGVAELLVHSGQHYDHGMSDVFFDELGLPEPYLNLGVGSASQGAQTGVMLQRFEAVMLSESTRLGRRPWGYQLHAGGRAGGGEAGYSRGAQRGGAAIFQSGDA